ncbi:MAG: hypothetical protein EPO11_04640 [Gammaproteobacteria bacterium]|nr:MAG: hypothetical protein EPO11_04640 [Gammaproteobacteria bacterium]
MLNKRKDRVNSENEYSLVVASPDVLRLIGSFIPDEKSKSAYARTNKAIHKFFQPDLDRFALKQLLQAVVDDDRDVVKRILDAKPELLLIEPKIKEEIESQKTRQRFQVGKPFEIATKRRQLEMVKMMLPYFDKLEDGKAKALAQWKVREISEQEKKQYVSKMKALINVIAKETFPMPYGAGKGGIIDMISKETKMAIEAFRKELLPRVAIVIDDYVDVEQLLIAGYKAYVENFHVFQTDKQRDLYCAYGLCIPQRMLKSLGFDFLENLHDDDGTQLLWQRTSGWLGKRVAISAVSILKNYIDEKQASLASLREGLQESIRNEIYNWLHFQ